MAEFLGVGPDEGVGQGRHAQRRRTGVEPAQGVEVVDQGLEEDGPPGDPSRVPREGAGIPGEGAQQLRGPDPARVDGGPRGGEARGEAAVEAHLKNHPGSFSGGDRPVRVLERHGHRLLHEDVLARLGGSDDELSMRAGRGRDNDGVDVGVVPDVVDVLGGHGHPQGCRQPSRGTLDRVVDGGQFDAGHPVGQKLGVAGADPPSPQQRHPHSPRVFGCGDFMVSGHCVQSPLASTCY